LFGGGLVGLNGLKKLIGKITISLPVGRDLFFLEKIEINLIKKI